MIDLLEAKYSISFNHDYNSDIEKISIANSNTCFYDLIAEIADESVDDDWYTLEQWMIENMSEVEDAISEYGWEGCGGNMHKAIQIAQMSICKKELINDLPYYLRDYAFDYLDSKEVWDVPDDFLENLDELCGCDSYSFGSNILNESFASFCDKLLSIVDYKQTSEP